ncbi:hypothetical protein HanXRQr2_Chr04g0190121 [Helianthus annuus]|uniref:Uncharacterized protein n=1 Tax=Helianthus annuus TaxID=4232 RepID=A0A9K3JC27_HELAN|nr:hypothetical protein HanXRQr2_Chr04g0190121 [Helianthus annuus]KAJ0933343.1 hypothetical protein HanPSC8_Chr04g0183721 [Helianthus annuus]
MYNVIQLYGFRNNLVNLFFVLESHILLYVFCIIVFLKGSHFASIM